MLHCTVVSLFKSTTGDEYETDKRYESITGKSPLKFFEKRERGRIQGLLNFWGYPLLSQEGEKLQISNLASTFEGSIRTKAH